MSAFLTFEVVHTVNLNIPGVLPLLQTVLGKLNTIMGALEDFQASNTALIAENQVLSGKVDQLTPVVGNVVVAMGTLNDTIAALRLQIANGNPVTDAQLVAMTQANNDAIAATKLVEANVDADSASLTSATADAPADGAAPAPTAIAASGAPVSSAG